MIKEAAILKDGKIYTGLRHSHIIKKYGNFNNKNSIQGFVTDNGIFLNREKAAKHAFECGQIKKLSNCLMSEELW